MHFANTFKLLSMPMLALLMGLLFLQFDRAFAEQISELTSEDIHRQIITCAENVSYESDDVEQSLIDCPLDAYFRCIETGLNSYAGCSGIVIGVLESLNADLLSELNEPTFLSDYREFSKTCNQKNSIPGYLGCDLVTEGAVFVASSIALNKASLNQFQENIND